MTEKIKKPNITKVQFEILNRYKVQIESAKLGYIRGVYPRDIEILVPIYEKLGYKLSSKSCGICILNMFRDFGNELSKINKK